MMFCSSWSISLEELFIYYHHYQAEVTSPMIQLYAQPYAYEVILRSHVGEIVYSSDFNRKIQQWRSPCQLLYSELLTV